MTQLKSLMLTLLVLGPLGCNSLPDSTDANPSTTTSNQPTVAPLSSGGPVSNPTEEASTQVSRSVTDSALAFAEGLFGSKAFNQYLDIFGGNLFSGNQIYSSNSISDLDESQFQETVHSLVHDFLGQLLSTDSDQTFTLAPTAAFCAQIASNSDEGYRICLDVIAQIQSRIQFSDEHSAQLTLYFGKIELLSIAFSPSRLEADLSVSALPLLSESLNKIFVDHGIDPGLPTFSSASGVLHAKIFRKANDIQFELTATQDLKVISDWSGTPASLQLAAHSYANLEYLRDQATASIQLNLNQADLRLGDLDIQIPDAASGKFTFNEILDQLEIENLTLANHGLLVSNQEQTIFSVILNPTSATVSFLQDGLALNLVSALGLSVTLSDGSTTLSGETGTQVTVHGNLPALVENGTLNTANSGSFGDGNLSILPNQCFSGIPWQSVSCQ